MIWNDKQSGGKQDGSFWHPQAPYGYIALGDVACNGYDPPSTQFTAEYACIRVDLLSEGAIDTPCQLCGPIKARVLQWMSPSGT